MSGITLRVIGAAAITVGLICLLSGWSAVFAVEGTLFTALQCALVLVGLVMVYRGENVNSRHPK
ncbi:hypothetical protein AUR04nite_19910 [Glutamicibacter uratoxydans]|uniref:Uncharacterized protein n=1 Tax=Glutamicibacter uratoxydans TaxID=43667 RepID=A0A4Y4DM84_GLUUR|nr:hypothetical protein [Glutamicibacter uratoxydans]GED06459.1 hypothetical protein AUR04nite_19910 [Glutamicibacter uratoxydans]